MRSRLSWLAAALLVVLSLAGLAPTASAATHSPPGQHPVRHACAAATTPGYAACLALFRTGLASHRGLFQAGTTPPGYGPADLRSAYSLPSASAGAGQTVAIVDAYDNPYAAVDLAVYRAEYGLPPCTAASGCFRKVAQDGSTNYPTPDYTGGWEGEESLDVDMVSAICPDCHILLVEADSARFTDLGLAVDEAVKLGAKYVSNSYAGADNPAERSWDSLYYNHPGVAVTASAGDTGYGAYYPAASPDVTAVGGTSLTRDSGTPRGWTETAWNGTGSGCSRYEPKPAWQTDPGCPHRTVADVSADADPYTGVAIYDTYKQNGWQVAGGTSVGSPLIASVFALGGPPAPSTYPSSYPYAHTSALNDITQGANGSCHPAYLCTAGPGYDGPTGLGTPDGVTAFHPAPYGTISGTLTDAATGAPLPGATVTAGAGSATTGADGGYALAVPPGTYQVAATGFDYHTKTAAGVRVTLNHTVTENFALAKEPTTTLTGTVADGSGHGWPLYARVSVPGTPAVTFTDPATGRYRLTLPTHARYTLLVHGLYTGYEVARPAVTIGAGAAHEDVSLTANHATCKAPGFRFDGPLQKFASGLVPPGWKVVTLAGKTPWQFTPVYGIPNNTGGGGRFAVVYPFEVPGGSDLHTDLVTSAVDMTADQQPVLRFDQALIEQPHMRVEVDVSTDGGHTWTTLWKHSGSIFGPDTKTFALPMAAGKPDVQVRFQYVNPSLNPHVNQYWELDDVYLGNLPCAPVPGGLVTGQVTDGNTGATLDGATVTSVLHPDRTTVTAATPADSQLGGGFYHLFTPATGSQQFTAALTPYRTGTTTVNVRANQVTQASLALRSGRLAITPGAVSVTEQQGQTRTVPVTFTDTGGAPLTVTLHTRPGTFTGPSGRGRLVNPPAQRIPGRYSPLAIPPGQTLPGKTPAGKTPAGKTPAGKTAAPQTGTAGWNKLPHYPLQIIDNAAATDPTTGDVYSVGGYDGTVIGSGYVYSPATRAWTALPDLRYAREAPQVAFIAGRLYVVGGWDPNGSPVATLEIYDPATRHWSAGASIPTPLAGAGVAVTGGRMYVIGGCDAQTCGYNSVQIYDPASNTWTAGPDYPTPVSWQSCGTIQGRIYCASGVTSDSSDTTAAYGYSPAARTWTALAPMPTPQWGAGYTASNGRLLVSGGVLGYTGDEALTNVGYAYDAASNTWTPLPNTPTASYRGASACGFYRIGGDPNSQAPVASNWTYQLPGYEGCEFATVPWLAESQTRFTLRPGQSVQVELTLNAGDPSVTGPGGYATKLAIGQDTPYQVADVPVTMNVTAHS